MNVVRTAVFTIATAVALSACEDASKKQPAASVGSALPVPAAPTAKSTETLTFSNDRSKVGFVGSKITGSHEGSFDRFKGAIHLTGGKAEGSSVEVEIDTDSVKIQPEKLQTHMKSPDFFDAAKYPKVTFKSTEIKAGGAGGATHTVTGNLNLHGKEKSISFPATIAVSDAEVSAKADFSIDRRDYDIVYPGMPNDLIRDGVVIRFDLNARRAAMVPVKDKQTAN